MLYKDIFMLIPGIPRFFVYLLLIASCLGCSQKDNNAEFITTFGSEGSGKGQFSYVEDFAFDQYGNVLITDALNANVQVFKPDGTYITMFGGRGEKKDISKSRKVLL